MKSVLLLAWRYVAYHRLATVILTACIALVLVLPLAMHLLIAEYQPALLSRARATPLLLGPRGNRFDLTLKALYFRESALDPVPMSELDALRETGLAEAIPLHVRYTARRYPVVGTTIDYFEFRGLHAERGTLPLILGQCVLGSKAAAELGLGPGDYLFTDQKSLYDISKTYPLKMQIAGVLAASGTADDEAVFVDIKTAWVVEGITHGHQAVEQAIDPALLLNRTKENVTTNLSIMEYNEVTPENIDSFHVHAARDALPITAVIVMPRDEKSSVLLKSRYGLSKEASLLVPEEVIAEMFELIFKVKKLLDANFGIVVLSTAMFVVLVVLLSRRLRQREMETMRRIGCSRERIVALQAAELGIVLVMSLALTAPLALGASAAIARFIRLM